MAFTNVPGTWGIGGFRLPDFALTELLSSSRGKTSNPMFNNPAVYAKTGGVPSPQNVSTLPWIQPGIINTTKYLSTPKKQASGGTLSGIQQVQQTQQVSSPYSGMEQSAQDAAQAELEAALNEYDYQRQNLESQSAALDTQRTSSLGTLEAERGRAETEHQTAEREATSATESAKNKALSTAQDIQKKNRNILRALGILSSSAGGEMLAKPMTEYGTQAAELQQGLVDRLGKVEDWWMQRQQDFAVAKQNLETQYAQLKENIANDLRFNDRQRLTAIKAAGAALSQRLAEIQQQTLSYQTAAKQYSDNILLQIAQMKMYQNPTADVSAIYNTLLSGVQGTQSYQPGIVQSEEQRKRLLGSA